MTSPISKKDLRIIYMGTPDFAVESLRRLVEGGYRVVAVVTMPDKPVGRHQNHLQASPVKQYALSVGLPVLQPERLKSPEFLDALSAYQADLQIVVAFRMLPEVVWAMPRLGTFNLHASLLPQYRGAAPINWAIINGEQETGVTTFFLQHDIDTGRIIRQARTPISDTDTAGTLHDRLMTLGADLVTATVDDIIAGRAQPVEQVEEGTLHPAPKIFKDTCRIAWSAGARRCRNFVRGLSPYPAAWTELVGPDRRLTIKVYAAEVTDNVPELPIGAALLSDREGIIVRLSDGALRLTEVQPTGKRRMAATDFVRGLRGAQEVDWRVE